MAKSHHKYKKELQVLMLNNGFKLARENKHLVWVNDDDYQWFFVNYQFKLQEEK